MPLGGVGEIGQQMMSWPSTGRGSGSNTHSTATGCAVRARDPVTGIEHGIAGLHRREVPEMGIQPGIADDDTPRPRQDRCADRVLTSKDLEVDPLSRQEPGVEAIHHAQGRGPSPVPRSCEGDEPFEFRLPRCTERAQPTDCELSGAFVDVLFGGVPSSCGSRSCAAVHQ